MTPSAKPVVYLAGAISEAHDPRTWRNTATRAFAEAGWLTLNPLDLEAASASPEGLVRWDKALIMQSSVVLASLNEPSWGTAMEIAFAKQHDVPVVGFTARQKLSPWIIHHCDRIEMTLAGAVETILRTLR